MKAVYAGSFDPVTNGHIDIITRSANVFDEVIVAIATNTSKAPLFTAEEKQVVLESLMHDRQLHNVSVMQLSEGLTVDFAKQHGAEILIRGIRSVKDMEYEMDIESMNKVQNPDVETVFFMADKQYRYLSSSMIKEVAKFGGNLDELVPAEVARLWKEKLQ